MSAGARQSALDALRRDENVIVIEKGRWFRNLHSSIHHAATRRNFEDYLYGPLMEIFGTYVKTCGHGDLEATVIPQGCFELRMASCTKVARNLSDFLVAIHSTANPANPADPADPQYGKCRLGGWVEAKPWDQPSKNPKKKAAANKNKRPGEGGAEDIVEVGDILVEGERVAEDVNIDEVDIAEEGEGVDADEDSAMSVGGPSIEDASALVLDSEEVARRLAEDLHQLCRQAYFAFHHFIQDVIYVFVTYGMTFSCFKFTRPADWDSIRGDKEGTVSAPEPVYSNERMVFGDHLNPHLLQALHLMTTSMGMSYQPSWFQIPSSYHEEGEPDLAVARDALARYDKRIKEGPTFDSPGSNSPDQPLSSKSSPSYSPTSSEDAAPVGELGCGLRSGKGRSITPARSPDSPVVENEGIETPDSSLEQRDRVDAASSDVDDSPLNERLRPKQALSGRARHAIDVPMTSGVPGAAGPSTKDTQSLTGDTRAPAVKDSAPGVNSKDKFTTPKDHDKQIRKRGGKARQRKDTNSRTEANDPPLPALLLSPVHDAPISDGVGGSESQVLGHRPISQEAPGDNSRSAASSGAKPRKRKGRPSSPLRADSLDPDPTGSDASTLAGPSKKRRLVPEANERPAGNGTGPSNISRTEADRPIRAAVARGDASAERVHDPLTVRELTRPRNVYTTRAASEKRARYRTKPAAGTTETTATFAEPAAPARRSAIGTRSTAESSRAQVHNPPLPQRQDTTKNNKSRK